MRTGYPVVGVVGADWVVSDVFSDAYIFAVSFILPGLLSLR